jgi:hypothetical protein
MGGEGLRKERRHGIPDVPLLICFIAVKDEPVVK